MKKWLLACGLLLFLAPYLSAQTSPLPGSGGGGLGRFLDGSSTSPSIAFISSPNTGLWKASASSIEIVASGTAIARFDASGVEALGPNSITWSSTTGNAADNGLTRLASASLALTNGSTGGAGLKLGGTNSPMALPGGALGFATTTTASIANAGEGVRIQAVCGSTAGTAALVVYAGKSNTDFRVLVNNIGTQVTGC